MTLKTSTDQHGNVEPAGGMEKGKNELETSKKPIERILTSQEWLFQREQRQQQWYDEGVFILGIHVM